MTRTQYGAGCGPLAIAHRAGAGLAAENTLDAFARSCALGLRYLETDARVSADGVGLAFHDATLDWVLGRPGAVRATPSRYLRDRGVPTIAELLRAFPDACFTIDVKDEAAVAPLAEALQETGAAHRVCAAGAWDGWLARLRTEVAPELTTALGWRALVALVAGAPPIPPWWHEPGRFAHVPVRLMNQRLIDRAHMLGVRVITWTVNEPGRMQRLLDAGVDGIITDRPDLLREVLITRDQWMAPSDSRVS